MTFVQCCGYRGTMTKRQGEPFFGSYTSDFWKAYPELNRFSISVVQEGLIWGKDKRTSQFSGSREKGSPSFHTEVACSRRGCEGTVSLDDVLRSAVWDRKTEFTHEVVCRWGRHPCLQHFTISGTLEFVEAPVAKV